MENWDPEFIGALAKDRPIILFDNAGVGESSGETPSTIAEMAKNAASFINALGLQQVDVLGLSIGVRSSRGSIATAGFNSPLSIGGYCSTIRRWSQFSARCICG
ncbi:alpha/beta fold hydrolase [Neobacillus ginsengisoli]|uniref:Pimeloyl-ACP methyl ester carboxylesterase n=1 Tax=Neobacillus ginsengisoli TaxID=904295 RepID=A0ABT9Y296_9BACI|nr:alpha/beta hydrolase [Neobacillus ginsengisoli]MDQ0201269.1 pimeloyl-ACP methyl ester carboxylesterase [Neobacillus ginsengisoli]